MRVSLNAAAAPAAAVARPRQLFASRWTAAAVAAALALYPAPQASWAQSYAQQVRLANANTVTVVSSAPGETSLAIAHDLSTVLHCVNDLRVVPIAGRGDANNVRDLLFLRGVDMAIVRVDVLAHLAETDALVDDLEDRVRYIAPLFEQEVHLIASEEIESVADLAGRLVNVGPAGSLALPAARILAAAGVEVIESKFDNRLALERVIDGSIDAMFIVGGEPIPLLDQLRDVQGLHLVPIDPLESDLYDVAQFTHEDYPSLVEVGETVQTISVASVLTVYNWPSDSERFAKSRLFTETLFARAAYLNRPARHEKWATASLTDDVPGWTRFGPAQEIVDALRRIQAPAPVSPVALAPSAEADDGQLRTLFEAQLEEFGITPRDEAEREQLFSAFRRRMEAADQ